jgi:hypothetical protein
MTFEWIITFIGEVETVGQNQIQKRTFVLEEKTDKDYKASLAIDLLKDKVSLIDGYNIWDFVKVSINPRSNMYNGRYYNSLAARKIEGNKSGSSSSSSQTTDEDLPF